MREEITMCWSWCNCYCWKKLLENIICLALDVLLKLPH